MFGGTGSSLYQHRGCGAGFFKKRAGRKMHDQEYLTPEEASKYLRLSLGSIHKFIQQNELPASREGRLWKIKRSALEDFLENWGEKEEFPDHH